MSDMPVTRVSGNGYAKLSKQPRYKLHKPDPNEFFSSTLKWVRNSYDEEPSYDAVSSTRDEWLRKFVRKEPNLMGVIATVIDIDKNRGWRMIGGRNQVRRFTDILHNMQGAPGTYGWRPGISLQSQAFWGSDMGSITEIGRTSRDGAMAALYYADPVECELTGYDDYPLKYYQGKEKNQRYWRPQDYFRAASMPSGTESYNGLGYCAVSRCLDLAKIMIAVYEHDREVLGAKAPRGLMLLNNVTQKQWDDAMVVREARDESLRREYFGSLAVIASKGAKIEATLLALSELPKSFNLRDWMDMLLFGYSLCFNYDASEFWPVQVGALGRGTETEIQHEKATGKGRLDFVLSFQEQLQMALPDSLEFQFDQRDEKGDLMKASVNQAWANVVKTLYRESATISVEESRMLLADYGVIPRTWSPSLAVEATDKADQDEDKDQLEGEQGELGGESEEDTQIPEPDDQAPAERTVTARMRRLREELSENPYIFRAAEKFPQEPIVQYSYPANTMTVLWDTAEELLKRHVWTGCKTY